MDIQRPASVAQAKKRKQYVLGAVGIVVIILVSVGLSTLEPAAHRARYLGFMRSPAYVLEHDMVAVARDGTIASFTIYWPDAELSLAQFEPVGTHPDFQRRGLAPAVIHESLARLARAGIRRARVLTGGANEAAKRTYLAIGFELVDQVGAFRAPASFGS